MDFAEIINKCETAFGDTKAYAFLNFNRKNKEKIKKTLKSMPGMKRVCEFQFWHTNEQHVRYTCHWGGLDMCITHTIGEGFYSGNSPNEAPKHRR